jgi:hypothetical protein
MGACISENCLFLSNQLQQRSKNFDTCLIDRMLLFTAAFFSGFHSGIRKALQDENHQIGLTVSAHQKTLENVAIC